MPTPTVQITIRLAPALYEALQRKAGACNVSLAEMVRHLLSEGSNRVAPDPEAGKE